MLRKVDCMKNQGFAQVSGGISSVVFGVVFSLAVIFVLSFLPAVLIMCDIFSTSHLRLVSMLILAVGGVLGGYKAAVKHGCNGMVMGIFVGLFDLLAIVFLSVIFHTVSFEMVNLSLFFVKLFCLVLFGAIGGILGINKN